MEEKSTGPLLLEVRDLTVRFSTPSGVGTASAGGRRRLRAVDGVSFSIRRDESVGIVGESGCGKSTVARTLVGLLEPCGGQMLLDGEIVDFSKLERLRRSVQMVFQDPASSLNPRLRTWVQVSEPLLGHKGVRSRARRRAQAERLLSAVGLDPGDGERFAHQFSGGQRQRVALARALALEPRLLVADEPMSNLDVASQAELSGLLAGLTQRRGLALLLISHDLASVAALTSRVLILYLGRIVEEGPTELVLRAGAHPYTRALVDAVPMLEPGADRVRTALGGEPPSPYSPPAGCAFHPRCPHAFERCKLERPALVEAKAGRGHRAACFLLGR